MKTDPGISVTSFFVHYLLLHSLRMKFLYNFFVLNPFCAANQELSWNFETHKADNNYHILIAALLTKSWPFLLATVCGNLFSYLQLQQSLFIIKPRGETVRTQSIYFYTQCIQTKDRQIRQISHCTIAINRRRGAKSWVKKQWKFGFQP